VLDARMVDRVINRWRPLTGEQVAVFVRWLRVAWGGGGRGGSRGPATYTAGVLRELYEQAGYPVLAWRRPAALRAS